jgi:hypothetical protein
MIQVAMQVVFLGEVSKWRWTRRPICRTSLGTSFAIHEANYREGNQVDGIRETDSQRDGCCRTQDQVQLGDGECRNPMKADFSHLRRLEGTSRKLTRQAINFFLLDR